MNSRQETVMEMPETSLETITIIIAVLQFATTLTLFLSGLVLKTIWSEINRLRNKTDSNANTLAGHEASIQSIGARVKRMEDRS